MEPRIETFKEKILVGKKLIMSFARNQTGELWQSFMPLRKEVRNAIGTDLYSLEVYPESFFSHFDPTKEFDKWAAVAVSDTANIPAEMVSITIPAGLYAVFTYKGIASAAAPFYQYIFNSWLPNSSYILDERPHFALMGAKYKNEDPDSEEEIWIPVKEII